MYRELCSNVWVEDLETRGDIYSEHLCAGTTITVKASLNPEVETDKYRARWWGFIQKKYGKFVTIN